MAKAAPFKIGVMTRDVASLKRRVQAIERVMWPSTNRSAPRKMRTRLIEVDEATARRLTIEKYSREQRGRSGEQKPRLRDRREQLRQLNAYLRARGFEPEPGDD